MLSLAILVPLIGAFVLSLWTSAGTRAARATAIALSAVPFALLVAAWIGFDASPGAPLFQHIEEAPWIPALGVAWRMGVDGIALVVATMSALLFVAAAAWPIELGERAREYYAWILFLAGVSLGVFLTLDLLLFYVFFDLSLVGMYFLIGRWGHGDSQSAALKFFLYTLAGSLAILLAVLGLVLAGEGPLTFDMRELIARQPLAGMDLRGGLVLLGFVFGFGIKTPLFPVHTWLPPAHVQAPAPASTILAGVLLKMGTFGLLRIPLAMMHETFARYALWIGLIALASILWGALVALGQTSIKRRIAYTSVNHMGYTVLGIAAAGSLVAGHEAARALALTGAVVEMVAHGLITGSLFLMAGSFWQRTQSYTMADYGGLAGVAPKLTAAFILAAFASLGLPGLAGFVAEFQIFAGTFAVHPWLAGLALFGILLTAALFLTMVRALFFGDRKLPDGRGFPDLSRSETVVLAALLALVVVIGVYPAWLLEPIMASARMLVGGAG
ncbi:oxidoreductase [Novosphingobium sp. PC22D]|uniref:complex I subunit 4 family protein n=1 Tax=Novosphingobium sp. PC22D TaxID=1962403 RepID=UPI000BF1DAFD|nr:NADH-quinone oxidoreductase subunit M [Novosphingobium sp. PC22D]PEQ11533.1 oxidoreductase [Novosphingobium sp. PC22D]